MALIVFLVNVFQKAFFFTKYLCVSKGQIISKRFFQDEDSSKKRTKTRRTIVKTNSFVRFLGESSAWKLAFEINWHLTESSS